MSTTRTTLTFEEFENLPDRARKDELVREELLEFPPAMVRYRRLTQRLHELLDAALKEAHARGAAQDAGEVCHEAELYFQCGAREVWHVYQETGRVVKLLGDRSETLSQPDLLTTPLLPGSSMPLTEIVAIK